MQSFKCDVVDSTNEEAKRPLAGGRVHGDAYVLAREQTSGKGTHGRTWISPRDAGLYLTVLSAAQRDIGPEATFYTLAAGVACAEALESATGLDVHLKPVNDIMVAGRKLGGILTETIIEEGRMTTLVIGVGVNVRKARRPLPGGAIGVTCLEELMSPHAFARLALDDLVSAIVSRVISQVAAVDGGDLEGVRRAWQGRAQPGSQPPWSNALSPRRSAS